MRSDRESSPSQEASGRRPGTPDPAQGLLKLLDRLGLPRTRQNYLDLSYLGSPPEGLGAEEEANLPEEIRHR